AVAAGLPGGDPLAAALAAGETPSPELVAAAGETEGLEPRIAAAWLAAALVGLAATIFVEPRASITSKLNLETSPEALTRDARVMIRAFGYTAKPADAVWGLEYDDDYKQYTARHHREAEARWKNPVAGQPPIVGFWYRESPQPIAANRRFSIAAGYDNPPMEASGMVRIRTDTDGKLTAFEAVPPQVQKQGGVAPAFDWNRLFQAAGLNLAEFQPAEPLWTSLASSDSRAAWTGVDAATGAKLRVEAAAWRGRAGFFRVGGARADPERMCP